MVGGVPLQLNQVVPHFVQTDWLSNVVDSFEVVTNFADSFPALWTDVTPQQMDPVLVNFQVVFFCKGLATLVTNMFLLGAMNLVNVSVEALVPEDDVDHGNGGGDDDKDEFGERE